MLSVITGAALIVLGCVSFWRLLPKNGEVHRLAEKYDGGAMLTIVLMSVLTAGIALFCDGLFG